ncbi:hypothetical protein GPALN_012851 [Globodera pallida]|nr:hypothetical protein GPALN_012851 [Globodera pallida]
MKRHERSPPGVDLVPASQRRRLSFSHSDLNNPEQAKELFEQCLDQVLRGLHPVSRDTAIRLAAIHCYIQFGQYHKGVELNIRAYNLLPKEYTHGKSVHSREHEKNIIEQYRNLSFADAMAAKRKYCDICRNLPTYGMIFFEVKEPQGTRLVPRLFGVNKECVMSVDKKSKIVRKLWPLEQLRRWAAGPTTFNIDFGDYQDGYYSVQTTEAEKIKRLIAEFVDVIIWVKKIVDPFGLEGDEGAIMIEDFVLRARSVPLSLGDVVEEDEPIKAKMHPAAMPPFIPGFTDKITPPKPEQQFPRPKESSLIYATEFPPIGPDFTLRTQTDKPQLVVAQPPQHEQYDQLSFAKTALSTSPFPDQNVPSQLPVPQLPQKTIPLPQDALRQPPTTNGSQSLPPSLTSSMHQKYQKSAAVSPASMSILTEQEIVYEISIRNGGQAQRSFEQYYSQNRNLQGLRKAIEQSVRRMGESRGQLTKRQIVNFSLTEEQRQMAIQLGEDTIRHRAVVFLASTAQIVEWTSDHQLRPKYAAAQIAVVQASDNLCEMVQCFCELCAIRPETMTICPVVSSVLAAFSDLLAKLNPEKCEKRSAFLSSASLVGETVFTLLNALNDEEEEAMEDRRFYVAMNEVIQQVANGTANLVIQAKSLPTSHGESERVIESATNVALFTSELIALSRVLVSIMAHPACQKRVQSAVEKVRSATRELLEHAKADAFNQFALTGTAEHYAQMHKNALMAEMALKQLLNQTVA